LSNPPMPPNRVSRALAASVALAALGCTNHPPPPPALTSSPPPASAEASPSPSADAVAPAATPVPEALQEVAARFGLSMLAGGWSWKAIDRDKTRFDWSATPAAGDHEVLYSFWMDHVDETTTRFLPQIVASAAANLTAGEPCAPFDQHAELVQMLGVDRIITVCFEPAPFMSKTYRHGVLHGILHRGALSIVVVLANDGTGIVPLPTAIGMRGAP
jgi:hypothetical protein